MTTQTIAPRVHVVPATIGFCLWAGATALMTVDALETGHLTTAHALAPVLTASTVASAVFAHHRLMSWRLIGAAMFAALALFGSALTCYSTLGRVAHDKDAKLGDAMRDNRNLDNKLEDLKAAKASAKVECKNIGPKCTQWLARVDVLTRETANMSTRALNPQIDSVVKLATLLGFNGAHVRQLIEALDAPSLPLYLELGSISFFGAAFPRRRATVTQAITVSGNSTQLPALPRKVFSRHEALADFRTMKASNSQQFLAERWGVHEGTASKWLGGWEADGAIERTRHGKANRLQAVPQRKLLTAPR